MAGIESAARRNILGWPIVEKLGVHQPGMNPGHHDLTSQLTGQGMN
jgi:hypothetical protein